MSYNACTTIMPGRRGARFRAHVPRGRSLQHDACRPRRMAKVRLELGLGFELGLGLATRAAALQESPCRPRVALWAQELSLSFAASMTQRGSVPARLLSRLHRSARPYLYDVCQTGLEPRTSTQPGRFMRLSLALDRIFELVFTFNPSITNALMHSVPFIGNQTSIALFMISQVVSTPRAQATPTHPHVHLPHSPALSPALSPDPSPDPSPTP